MITLMLARVRFPLAPPFKGPIGLRQPVGLLLRQHGAFAYAGFHRSRKQREAKALKISGMRSDQILLIVVILGVGLALAYMITDLVQWKTVKAANQRAIVQAREMDKRLHSTTRALRRRPFNRKPTGKKTDSE
jgi:hypothetical protein